MLVLFMMTIFSTSLFASDMPPIVVNEKISLAQLAKLIETKGTAKTNSLSISVEILQKNKKLLIPIQQFKDKLSTSGGDDVGNGGDTLREQIYQSANSALEELVVTFGSLYTFFDGSTVSLAEFSEMISEDKVVIVESIKNQTKLLSGIDLNYFAFKSMLFLKRSYIDNLVKENKDLRQLLLHLLIVANGKTDLNFRKSLELYSVLGHSSINNIGRNPVCTFNYSDLTFDNHIFSGAITVDVEPRKSGIKACEDAKLSECRITSFSQSSSRFGSLASFKVFYEGKKVSVERRSNKCDQAKICREIYNTAPLGQIGNIEFTKIENEFTHYCL